MGAKSRFGAYITAVTDDPNRIGIINDITRYISFVMSVNIRKFCLGTEDGVFDGFIDLYVNDMGDLEKLIKKLQKIEGIQSVIRTDL